MAELPTLHRLDVFCAVAHQRSFTRAAETLHLTQPAVSRHVQHLEQQLGVGLFRRAGRLVQLTEAGQEVLLAAQRIAGVLEEMRDALDAYKGLKRGNVRLVATTTAGEYLLPPLVAAFQRAYPGMRVALRVANRAEVLKTLTEGNADLAVMGRPPPRAGWTGRPILPNELVAIAAPEHPHATGPRLRPAALARETFFLREAGSGTRVAVQAFLERAGVSLDAAVELGSDSAIKQAVMAGLGVSILSSQAIELEVSVGRLIVLAVAGLPLRRQWYVVSSPGSHQASAVAAFQRFLEAAVVPQDDRRPRPASA